MSFLAYSEKSIKTTMIVNGQVWQIKDMNVSIEDIIVMNKKLVCMILRLDGVQLSWIWVMHRWLYIVIINRK